MLWKIYGVNLITAFLVIASLPGISQQAKDAVKVTSASGQVHWVRPAFTIPDANSLAYIPFSSKRNLAVLFKAKPVYKGDSIDLSLTLKNLYLTSVDTITWKQIVENISFKLTEMINSRDLFFAGDDDYLWLISDRDNYSRQLYVIDPLTCKVVHTQTIKFPGRSDEVGFNLRVAPKGHRMAFNFICDGSNGLQMWDTSKWTHLQWPDPKKSLENNEKGNYGNLVGFSRDGSLLVTSRGVWDTATGRLREEVWKPTESQKVIKLSPDRDEMLVVEPTIPELALIPLTTGRKIRKLKGLDHFGNCIWSSDASKLIVESMQSDTHQNIIGTVPVITRIFELNNLHPVTAFTDPTVTSFLTVDGFIRSIPTWGCFLLYQLRSNKSTLRVRSSQTGEIAGTIDCPDSWGMNSWRISNDGTYAMHNMSSVKEEKTKKNKDVDIFQEIFSNKNIVGVWRISDLVGVLPKKPAGI